MTVYTLYLIQSFFNHWSPNFLYDSQQNNITPRSIEIEPSAETDNPTTMIIEPIARFSSAEPTVIEPKWIPKRTTWFRSLTPKPIKIPQFQTFVVQPIKGPKFGTICNKPMSEHVLDMFMTSECFNGFNLHADIIKVVAEISAGGVCSCSNCNTVIKKCNKLLETNGKGKCVGFPWTDRCDKCFFGTDDKCQCISGSSDESNENTSGYDISDSNDSSDSE